MDAAQLLNNEDAVIDLIKQMAGTSLNSDQVDKIKKAFRIMKPHIQRASEAGRVQ